MTKKQPCHVDMANEAEIFAENSHIMTIAVASGNIPWAAPVYYVFYNKGFWFFSSENSRHITDAERNSGLASAAVCGNPHDWKEIKGLQMQGTIKMAGISAESGAAFSKYIRKFGFIEKMISCQSVKTVPDLESLFSVRWYVFIPDEIYYTDNSAGFGTREKLGKSFQAFS